jgi:hypothetical protein
MQDKRIRTAGFAVLLAIVNVTGCATSHSDFVVALPNGYQIVRDKKAAPIIVKKKGGTVVPGPVARYTVVRDMVIGVVQATPTDEPAYFVLNTRTGEVGKNLAESDYTERLKALNIASAPELSPPVLPE